MTHPFTSNLIPSLLLEEYSNLYLKIDKIQEEKITTAEFMEICKMYKDNIEECLDYLITNY